MTDEELLARIAANPKVMVGKPVIQGTRLTVELILDRLAHGAAAADLLQEFSGLQPEDIRACLLFASRALGKSA